jgi:hypothetical protein
LGVEYPYYPCRQKVQILLFNSKWDTLLVLNTENEKHIVSKNRGTAPLKVETYIANPLCCYNCQKFGHSSDRCKNEKVCFRCGSENCSAGDCREEPKCVNCNESHPSSSKQSTVWIKEKEIKKLKIEKHLSYPEARKLYSSQHPNISYAAMLKKKTTREIACQTDSEMSPPKENKSTSNVKDNVDNLPKQVISAPSKPNIPTKPR